jgi:hypothetical protein
VIEIEAARSAKPPLSDTFPCTTQKNRRHGRHRTVIARDPSAIQNNGGWGVVGSKSLVLHQLP